MKRIWILGAPIVTMALLAGCSSDINSPSFKVYKSTASPTSLVASYDAAKDKVNLFWAMADPSGVKDFFVTASDSSLIDAGEIVRSFPMNIDMTMTQPYSFVYDTSVYVPADVDSVILYFTVSAVYKNAAFNLFIGPRAVADSAMVKR